MKVLIKQAHIICPSSPFNGQTKDILITDGIITSINDSIEEKADQLMEKEGLHISIGWMDVFADFGDPGYEFKETITTGASAAAAGGFTDVMLMPNSNPVVHNKSQVEYIIQKSREEVVSIYPIGAVTKNAEGMALSEMYDMYQTGAIAFSDGINSIQNGGLVLKALEYVKTIDATIIQVPDDKSIGTNGLINEGIISTQLGLPGKPAMAEELMVARDIKLTRHADSRLHFTGISSAKSLEYINSAKEAGLKVSCSVTPYHCCFCDEDLTTYDTNLKVNPPLRNRADMMAMREALINGTIDCIASHHQPQNWDSKTCEFEYAGYGMTGLETLFAVINSVGCPLEKFVKMQTINARNIFNIPVPEIKEGATACLSLFCPEAVFIYEENNIRSKSKNSPFIGKTFKGKVIGIINKNKVYLNN